MPRRDFEKFLYIPGNLEGHVHMCHFASVRKTRAGPNPLPLDDLKVLHLQDED